MATCFTFASIYSGTLSWGFLREIPRSNRGAQAQHNDTHISRMTTRGGSGKRSLSLPFLSTSPVRSLIHSFSSSSLMFLLQWWVEFLESTPSSRNGMRPQINLRYLHGGGEWINKRPDDESGFIKFTQMFRRNPSCDLFRPRLCA